MDFVTIVFYAIVCAVLGLAAPALRGWRSRLVIGALVGIAASAGLPMLRASLGV